LKFVHSVVGNDAQVAVSPNERLVTVRALPEKQEALSKAWPRIACVGQTRYDVEYKTYKSCVYLVETALKQDGIPPLGAWSDGLDDDTLYCGHVLGKE
jgi:hypothetical protein